MNDVQQRAIDMLRGTRSIGFHYESYNENILLPMIRPEIYSLKPRLDGDFVLVYLRGDASHILSLLTQVDLPVEWRVYHRDCNSVADSPGNITFRSPCRMSFTEDLENCLGIFADAGFGITSEALHLGLPLVCRPVKNHFEQQANAAALRHITSVGIVDDLDSRKTIDALQQSFGATLTHAVPWNGPD